MRGEVTGTVRTSKYRDWEGGSDECRTRFARAAPRTRLRGSLRSVLAWAGCAGLGRRPWPSPRARRRSIQRGYRAVRDNGAPRYGQRSHPSATTALRPVASPARENPHRRDTYHVGNSSARAPPRASPSRSRSSRRTCGRSPPTMPRGIPIGVAPLSDLPRSELDRRRITPGHGQLQDSGKVRTRARSGPGHRQDLGTVRTWAPCGSVWARASGSRPSNRILLSFRGLITMRKPVDYSIATFGFGLYPRRTRAVPRPWGDAASVEGPAVRVACPHTRTTTGDCRGEQGVAVTWGSGCRCGSPPRSASGVRDRGRPRLTNRATAWSRARHATRCSVQNGGDDLKRGYNARN